MSTYQGPPTTPYVGDLRSIADAIEPMFPTAADTLRGIARQMEAAALPAPEPTP